MACDLDKLYRLSKSSTLEGKQLAIPLHTPSIWGASNTFTSFRVYGVVTMYGAQVSCVSNYNFQKW